MKIEDWKWNKKWIYRAENWISLNKIADIISSTAQDCMNIKTKINKEMKDQSYKQSCCWVPERERERQTDLRKRCVLALAASPRAEITKLIIQRRNWLEEKLINKKCNGLIENGRPENRKISRGEACPACS